MKTNIILLLLFSCISFNSSGQIFLIDLNDSAFLFNKKTLKANEKICHVFNCLSKNFSKQGNTLLNSLIVFKVFDYKNLKKISSKPINSIELGSYMKNAVLPKLNLDMQLKGKNFEVSNSDANYHVIDSLVVYDGKSYSLIQGGVIILEFFNIYPYKQLNALQTNQSTLNIKANVVKVYSWVPDSLPIPNVEAMIDGRVFLLKRQGNHYTFFRHPFDCSDCPLSFYNEYVYKKGYGIIAFKSKYLFFNNSEFVKEKIGESNEYFYFR